MDKLVSGYTPTRIADQAIVKIKSYKLSHRGLRAFYIGVPKAWIEDMGLVGGDMVNVYRAEDGSLVLRAGASERAH